MIKGWCKRNYHTDGKRRFGNLINGLCIECCSSTERQKAEIKLIKSTTPRISLKADQVNQIIKSINEVPGVASMRQGFNKIDELGIGWWILGYDNDEKYLVSEFKRQISHLRQQRTCGRLEKIIGVEIGSYSFSDLYPLFQFRVVMQGKIGHKSKDYKPKFNSQAISLIKETWAVAQRIADGLPDRPHIILAVEEMAREGKARFPKIRQKTKWEEEYISLLKTVQRLNKENQQLRKQLNCQEPRRVSQTVEEYREKMIQLYKEQARQQYKSELHS
jgi:hypothetical protein